VAEVAGQADHPQVAPVAGQGLQALGRGIAAAVVHAQDLVRQPQFAEHGVQAGEEAVQGLPFLV